MSFIFVGNYSHTDRTLIVVVGTRTAYIQTDTHTRTFSHSCSVNGSETITQHSYHM